MFGLGFGEILLILAVALIVVGPKKLPDLARGLARGIAEFRRATDDIQRTVQRELHAPIRDDFLKDLDAARTQVAPGPPPAVPEEPPKKPEAAPPAAEKTEST
ncbi:MAG: twin-arginine translocase subunit TatB [Deltaproteobacteria bacterium]|nr:twin-arginine translocase subunit TatB [Deltaproteobacteria bacterium]